MSKVYMQKRIKVRSTPKVIINKTDEKERYIVHRRYGLFGIIDFRTHGSPVWVMTPRTDKANAVWAVYRKMARQLPGLGAAHFGTFYSDAEVE